VVQIRVTLKTGNPFTISALSIFGVTWKWYFLNHAHLGEPGCGGKADAGCAASHDRDGSSGQGGMGQGGPPSPHYSREMRDQSQTVDIAHNYANGLFDEVFCNEISGPGVWWPRPISGGPMNYSG